MSNIFKRLDSGHARLLEKISSLDEKQFAQRPSKDEWSVGEIVQHLRLVEERVIKSLEDSLQQEPKQLGLLRRMVPTRIVSSRLIKVKAPKGVVPENDANKIESVDALNHVRSRLKTLYETHGDKRLAKTVFKHPFLGEISGVAAISFVAYHEQRHYKQICEVLQKLKR